MALSKCEKCNRNKVYLCSDKRNAHCILGCGYYAHLEGVFIYLGNDPGLQYAFKTDGSIKRIKRKEFGNITQIEEKRLREIEAVLKIKVNEKKEQSEKYLNASNWWYSLSMVERINVYEKSVKDKPISEPALVASP